jgi:hypothetical protein
VLFRSRAVAAIEFVLVIIEAMVPQSRAYLPLGGSHLAQLGLLFAALMIGIEVCGLFLERVTSVGTDK